MDSTIVAIGRSRPVIDIKACMVETPGTLLLAAHVEIEETGNCVAYCSVDHPVSVVQEYTDTYAA